MSQPYAFINDWQQTSVELKARLRLGKHAEAKFDMLNTHIRNVVVLPGQLVIIGDDSTALCKPEEHLLMQSAWRIRHSVMAEGGDAFALQNYDLLQKLLGYASLGIGTAGDAWNRHLKEIVKTLEEIDALHKQALRRGGGAAREEFWRVAKPCSKNWKHNCAGSPVTARVCVMKARSRKCSVFPPRVICIPGRSVDTPRGLRGFPGWRKCSRLGRRWGLL